MGHRRRCAACSSEHLLAINTLLATGESYRQISFRLKDLGTAMKPDTISAHYRICLDGKASIDEDEAVKVGQLDNWATTDEQKDFAQLIQKRAMELLAAGEIKVTANHGLQAQALLDRRAERAADRDLAVNIARLLSGAMIAAPMNVIEGTAYDLALAPARLVSGLEEDG